MEIKIIMQGKRFKAWVPNVSGSLSFSNIKGQKIIGRASQPKTFNSLSNEDQGCIFSIQERNLSDTAYAPFDKNGKFYYVLTAKVEDRWLATERLVGNIYTFPIPAVTRQEANLIKHFSTVELNQTKIKQLIALWNAREETINVPFILERDGFIELNYLSTNNASRDQEAAYSIVFETYSFFKDLVHSHKFHRYDDDAILVPYPIDDDTDLKWLDRTFRNLHKSIVSSYRNAHHQQDIINAIGKLSYLDSFQEAAKTKFGDQIRPDQIIRTSTLRSSLESKLELQRDKEQIGSEFLQTTLTVILSLFALMIAMSQLLQIPCIEGLTFTESCKGLGNEKLVFALNQQSIEAVQFVLKHWNKLTIAMPIIITSILLFAYWKRITRWVNNTIGHGYVGLYLRVILAFAASENYGKLLAFFWIGILFLVFCGLLYISTGIWHLS